MGPLNSCNTPKGYRTTVLLYVRDNAVIVLYVTGQGPANRLQVTVASTSQREGHTNTDIINIFSCTPRHKAEAQATKKVTMSYPC